MQYQGRPGLLAVKTSRLKSLPHCLYNEPAFHHEVDEHHPWVQHVTWHLHWGCIRGPLAAHLLSPHVLGLSIRHGGPIIVDTFVSGNTANIMHGELNRQDQRHIIVNLPLTRCNTEFPNSSMKITYNLGS